MQLWFVYLLTFAPLKKVVTIVLNRSCPAESQICSLIFVPSISTVRILKSTPVRIKSQIIRQTFKGETFHQSVGVRNSWNAKSIVLRLVVGDKFSNYCERWIVPKWKISHLLLWWMLSWRNRQWILAVCKISLHCCPLLVATWVICHTLSPLCHWTVGPQNSVASSPSIEIVRWIQRW